MKKVMKKKCARFALRKANRGRSLRDLPPAEERRPRALLVPHSLSSASPPPHYNLPLPAGLINLVLLD